MASSELWQWSAVDLAEGIRNRDISVSDAVTSAVERMRAVNPQINAVVIDTGDKALEQAAQLDQAGPGGSPGLLHGVPVTVKVNVDTEGYPNSNGVPKYADNIAPGDSPVIANLKKAGAIIIGITNTPEFSMRLVTDNPLYGQTMNPWDPTITPGGSSGGAGASIAMGVGAITHGNDIAGSLRWPAFCNGVSTIRPTQGRIPAFNPSAKVERPFLSQLFSTQGPLAREIRDVELGLAAMSTYDPRDPYWVPAPMDSGPAEKKVIVAEVPDGFDPDPAVMAAVDQAAEMLTDAGYALTRMPVPDLARAYELWWKLVGTEMKTMQQYMLEESAPDMHQVVANYYEMTGDNTIEDYMSAASERTGIIRKWLLLLEEHPVILSPLSMKTHLTPDGDLGTVDETKAMFDGFVFQAGLNVLGLPCVVTPTGLHEGRPIGVQLIASRFREDVALAAASVIGDRVGRLTDQLWARES